MTLRFAVIGWPVSHSRSPAMHAAAYQATGIDATYERVAVEPANLAELVSGLHGEGFRGVNVTLPHKEAVLGLVDVITETARVIGAANTITVEEDGRLEAHNTDAAGLVRALQEAGFDAEGSRVVVLGAGGAARASVVGLTDAGASHVTIAARRMDAAQALVSDLGLSAAACGIDTGLATAFSDADLLIQATSATLSSSPDADAFAAALPLAALPSDALVLDLVYTPLTTTVLTAAAARGLRTVDGLGMLVHQGALAFERWTGQPAPVAAMRDALA